MTTSFEETTAGQSTDMPAKIVIYGLPKTGKTRFSAQAPDVFFLNIEGGLDYLPTKVRATPKLNTFEEVLGWLKHIYENEKFTCGTIAVDSLDWIETLAQQSLVKQYNARSITDPKVSEFAYYKGVIEAANNTMKIFAWLDAIYNKKQIKSIVIAHSQIREVTLPTADPYMRNEMKVSKYLGAKAMEWSDLILFADYAFDVTSDGKPTEPKPMLFGGGSMAFVGGGRMKLKKTMPIDYKLLQKEITND